METHGKEEPYFVLFLNSPQEFRAWMHSELHSPAVSRIFIFLPVGENSPQEFRAWIHSELHSPAVNHPSAQRPVLPRKKNAKLSSRCPEAGSA
jgi:hypothetical protein